MAGFRIDVFKGMRPRISATKLRPGEAVTAQNLKLSSGDLEPLLENSTTQALLGANSRTIYLYDNDGTDLWLEWTDYVDVVKGPLKDDTLDRIYYTGDTQGNGAPKVTTNQLADKGGGGAYPEDWLYIGVPAPSTKPTIIPTDLPEDKAADERLAQDLKTDEFEIDSVEWTVFPGSGTRNQKWRLLSGENGTIFFDVTPGTAFRVTSVINRNKVTIESATEPGISIRTINNDKTTENDWQQMDEQGSTQEADFIGWRVPVDMEVKIAQHDLNVGDIIVVSAVNGRLAYYIDPTVDFFEQSWDPESTVTAGATSYENVRNARLSASATSGDTPWVLYGSFYYDVDRAASAASELEDRSYVYTYVNSFGEEGPPSPPSDTTALLDGQKVTVTGMRSPPTIGYDITKIRLYRTNSTEAGTEYQFVKEFDVSRTAVDQVLSEDLGNIITTTTWDPPPSTMIALTTMPNGMMVGFDGKQVHFCEPYFPHAWPAEYDQAIEFDVVGAASVGNSVVALTTGWPYVISGTHPRNVSVKPIKVNQSCSNKESIATDGDNVYYASPDGLVEISATGLQLVTRAYLDKEDWATYTPGDMVGEFYEGRYYGFYDFDVSAVEAVITAELSGTVTDADEADVIDGGKTIIITLTNDNWVAAGASFDAQRQDIIDGLTASTSQTLGWNNQIRDLELGVTDVARTSDTVVTITLPAASGYAIDSSEVITCTVPAAALDVSNAAVIAGSTFTIIPKAHATTVTMSGSLDTEAEVVAGGETIILTLTNDTWAAAGTDFDDERQGIIDGLVATTNEQDGWNDTVPHEIAVTAVVRTSDTVVTITLPAIADYAVFNNETLGSTIPHEALVTATDVDVVASNSIGITATGVPSATFGGTAVTGGVTENEIIAGSETLTITLTNETWVAAGTGPIGSTADSQALIDAIIAATSPTNGWNNDVLAAITVATDLVRTSATVATITLPAVATYSISSNETISCTIPAAVLTAAATLNVSNTFAVTNQDPITCVLSGTVTDDIEEDVIVDGGKTIILTLSNDTWKAAGTGPIGSTADTQAIIDGISAATSPATGWNLTVRDVFLAPADVVRTSDTVATITLPAAATYSISSTETITATVPTAAVDISGSAIVASPTFTIDDDVAASCAVTGTADNALEEDIVAGGKTIILTIADDEWVASGATFNAQRQNIIDGLDAATSPTNGWNNEVRDKEVVTAVVRTSDTVVTITLSAASAYAVTADEVITVTVPASALVQSDIAVTGDVTVDISANLDTINLILVDPDLNTTGPYIMKAEDSFTNWDEIEADATTSSYERSDGAVGYAPDTTTWHFAQEGETSGVTYIWRSTDDGATWAVEYTNTTPFQVCKRMIYNDTNNVWVVLSSDDIIYSTDDGLNWTLDAGRSETIATGRVGMHYKGSNFIAFGQFDDPAISDPFDAPAFYMSANLSTGSITDAFTKVQMGYDGSGAIDPGPMGSGNGLLVCLGINKVNADEFFVSTVPHGSSTTETYVGAFDTASGEDFRFDTMFDLVLGANWCMLTADGHTVTFDKGDESTLANWTYTSGAIDVSTDNVTLYGFYYDGGNTGAGKEGLGFVAFGKNNSSNKGVVYTSPDGITWTSRETFTRADSIARAGATKYPTSLD